MQHKAIIPVFGMTCNHCVNAVTKALQRLDGVISVSVSLENSSAELVYEEETITVEQMKKAIVEEGYSTDASVPEKPEEKEEKHATPQKAATSTFKVEGLSLIHISEPTRPY